MEALKGDVIFALRSLTKMPLVTGAAILSLALGIGANSAIFTLVHALFLRPPAVAEPERLVSVFYAEEGGQGFQRNMSFSRSNFLDLEERSGDVFSGLVNFIFTPANVFVEGEEPEQVPALLVSGNYFDVLGVRAAQGRTFLPDEDSTRGGHPVVVLSHRYWRERFGADPSVVGSTLSINSVAFEVVGVAAEGFEGTATLGSPSLWVPMAMVDTLLAGPFREWYDQRRAGLTNSLGRLRQGVSLEQARAAVDLVSAALAEQYPDANQGRSFRLVPYVESAINPAQREVFVRAGWVLMGAVGVVLLIACGNVAALLLGRASARRREIAIRLAMGASRRRLLRQLLTESVLLALLAGALGLLVATWLRSLLWSLRPPILQQASLDLSFGAPVLLFTLVLALSTGILFGLVPALQATRPELVTDLKDVGGQAHRRRLGTREILVMAQVALSFVALLGSGLFLRSLSAATRIDLGFRPEGLVTMTLDPGSNGLDAVRSAQYFDAVLERARSTPGVEAAALATVVPLTRADMYQTVLIEGRAREDRNNARLTLTGTVSDDYFRTLGLRFVAGRDFTATDRADTRGVAVVTTAMERTFWPEESALGKRFRFISSEETIEVVGVVETPQVLTVGEDPQPLVFLSREQSERTSMNLVARVDGEPEAMLATLRRAIQPLDPTLALTGVQTVESSVGGSLWAARMGAGLLAILGGVALALAAIGIYGVMSWAVAQRARELGIRIALGADRSRVLLLVLARALVIVAGGLAVGLLLALPLGRTLETLLYGISPAEPRTVVATTLILLVVALLASLLPARRATSVDPVRVLRFER